MLCKNIKKKRHIQEKSPFWRERRLAGLSQEKAAERLGISTRTLQKYERGKAQPRFDMVVRMAEIYGCDLYAFLCSRRAGGMTGYRYAPVRVRSFRPDCSCVYGILVRKLEGERTVALTVIPGLSPDKEAVHRFAEWCGREQLDPARLPEAIRAAFPDTVKTPRERAPPPESSRRGRFCLRFYSRDAKSAMASEIFSC